MKIKFCECVAFALLIRLCTVSKLSQIWTFPNSFKSIGSFAKSLSRKNAIF